MDEEVNVDVYIPLNAGNHIRRLEGLIHNLQPDEKADLVDRMRADAGEGAENVDDKEESSKVKDIRKQLAKGAEHLAVREAYIATLERVARQRDADSEDDKRRVSESKKLQKQLDETKNALDKQIARNLEIKEELAILRRDPKKRPSALPTNNDDAAERTGAEDSDDAEDNAPESDDIEGPDSSVVSAKLPVKQASSAKPPPTTSGFTPMPTPNANGNGAQQGRTTRHSSKANIQPDLPKTKKPLQTGPRRRGTGAYGGTGYEEDDSPAWGIDDIDPEAILRQNSRKSTAKGTTIPENAATRRSEAGESTGTPPVQSSTDGSGRKQSQGTTKTSKPTMRKVSEADDDFAPDVEEPRKSNLGKRSRGERSDGEEQPATSKKPKRESTLQSIREEPEIKGKHARATKGSKNISSAVKTKAPPSKQRKVAKPNSAEFDAGDFVPVEIPSGEDTDSDIEDEN